MAPMRCADLRPRHLLIEQMLVPDSEFPPGNPGPNARGDEPPEMRYWIWPVIVDEKSARWAVIQGCTAAWFCAAFIAAMTVRSFLAPEKERLASFDVSSFFDAGLFGIIGYFVYRNSRVASVVGFVLYAVVQSLTMPNSLRAPTCLMVAILLTAFSSGIRGTFAIHKFRRRADDD